MFYSHSILSLASSHWYQGRELTQMFPSVLEPVTLPVSLVVTVNTDVHAISIHGHWFLVDTNKKCGCVFKYLKLRCVHEQDTSTLLRVNITTIKTTETAFTRLWKWVHNLFSSFASELEEKEELFCQIHFSLILMKAQSVLNPVSTPMSRTNQLSADADSFLLKVTKNLSRWGLNSNSTSHLWTSARPPHNMFQIQKLSETSVI